MKILKIAGIALAVCVFLVLAYMVGSGFRTVTSAYIDTYSVSADGTSLTFRAGVASSIGYVRNFSDSHEDNVHYLKFISAFGGLNGSIGAKNDFTLTLNPEDRIIYVFRNDGYYPALVKNGNTGAWVRPEELP